MRQSCDWPGENELMIQNHDTEWGTPVHDDRTLFEFLMHPRHKPRVGRHEQKPQKTRLQVRRLNDLLRFHAIGRHG